jgi:ribosomal protein S27AE
MLCTGAAMERARGLAGATREAVEGLLGELERRGVGVVVEEAGGVVVVALRRCPLCGSGLETRVSASGCPRPGLRVEQRCPRCGWGHGYSVCVPPSCPERGEGEETGEEGCGV